MSFLKNQNPNPDREIRFFKHDSEPIVYVFMSMQMNMEAFYKMFPAAIQITEEQSDDFVLKQNCEVVYVGDGEVIDEYFNTDELKEANKNAVIKFEQEHKN